MNSCYLCVLSRPRLANLKNRRASEGFGTCSNCSAHACQVHGDILQGQTYFYCADCMTLIGLNTSLVRTPPPGTAAAPAQRLLLPGFPFATFAPGITAAAAPLANGVDDRAMEAALRDVVRGWPGILERDYSAWVATEPRTKRSALGLPPIDDYGDEMQAHDRILGLDVIELARDTVNRETQEWELRPPEEIPGEMVRLAAWALSTAYAARGAESLETSPFQLPGGLRLPPIALLTAMSYAHPRR
jgi:hypothetical protein